MASTTDPPSINIEEREFEIKDRIKEEPNQNVPSIIDEQGDIAEELQSIIKVDPEHSLLLEEDILADPELIDESTVVSGEQNLSTIELVRVDTEDDEENRDQATSLDPHLTGQSGAQTDFQEYVGSEELRSKNQFFRHLGPPPKRGRPPKKSAEASLIRKEIESITKMQEANKRSKKVKVPSSVTSLSNMNMIQEARIRSKKVRMERQRRKGLADLFDNLQVFFSLHY